MASSSRCDAKKIESPQSRAPRLHSVRKMLTTKPFPTSARTQSLPTAQCSLLWTLKARQGRGECKFLDLPSRRLREHSKCMCADISKFRARATLPPPRPLPHTREFRATRRPTLCQRKLKMSAIFRARHPHPFPSTSSGGLNGTQISI